MLLIAQGYVPEPLFLTETLRSENTFTILSKTPFRSNATENGQLGDLVHSMQGDLGRCLSSEDS